MNTLLDQIGPSPVAEVSGCIWCATITSQPCAAHGRQAALAQVEQPKAKRSRWAKPKRISKQDRIDRERRLGDELRAKRQRWAQSLTPNQSELLGPLLPIGVEVVR